MAPAAARTMSRLRREFPGVAMAAESSGRACQNHPNAAANPIRHATAIRYDAESPRVLRRNVYAVSGMRRRDCIKPLPGRVGALVDIHPHHFGRIRCAFDHFGDAEVTPPCLVGFPEPQLHSARSKTCDRMRFVADVHARHATLRYERIAAVVQRTLADQMDGSVPEPWPSQTRISRIGLRVPQVHVQTVENEGRLPGRVAVRQGAEASSALPWASSTSPRSNRVRQVSALTRGKRAQRASWSVAHGPGGSCSRLAATPSRIGRAGTRGRLIWSHASWLRSLGPMSNRPPLHGQPAASRLR